MKNLNQIINDNDGNLIISFSLILIFIVITCLILVLMASDYLNEEKTDEVTSSNIQFIIGDYKRNIETVSYESLNESIMDVISSKNSLKDSRTYLKDKINRNLQDLNKEYYKTYKVTVNSEITEVDNDENPFYIKVSGHMEIIKNNISYSSNDTFTIPITGLNDPLPVLKLKNQEGLEYTNEGIYYGESLRDYLNNKGLNNSNSYLNARSPSIIKECPYTPYPIHGNNGLISNCIENKYYHESSDGSCIFCRMEGKGNCSHYGIETFIITRDSNYSSSITSSDHVIFSDNPYYGNKINLNNSTYVIYLDNGHENKYGLDNY